MIFHAAAHRIIKCKSITHQQIWLFLWQYRWLHSYVIKIIWFCNNNFITIPHGRNLLREGGWPLISQGLPFFGLVPINAFVCRSQWSRGLRRRSAAARLLRLWIRISPWSWVSVCCECCVLSGRGVCDGLITRPEESYRLWCDVVCDLETSWMRRPGPLGGGGGYRAKNRQTKWSHLVETVLSGVQMKSW